jgi:hypothetical protein
VTVTYQVAVLSAAGDRVLDEFAAQFEAMLKEWEAAAGASVTVIPYPRSVGQ